jgi:hypothetical protein
VLRAGVEQGGLLQEGYAIERLVSPLFFFFFVRHEKLSDTVSLQVFIKEPTAIVYFTRQHTRDADSTWLQVRVASLITHARTLELTSLRATCRQTRRSSSATPERSAQPSMATPSELFDRASTSARTNPSLVTFDPSPSRQLRQLTPSRCDTGIPLAAGAVLDQFRIQITTRLLKTRFNRPHHLRAIIDEFESKVKTKFSGVDESFRLKFAPEGNDAGARVRNGWITLTG